MNESPAPVDTTTEKPSLLLHVCCGPCATQSVVRLQGEYDVTLFFSNSNISPRSEYDKRLEEARKLARVTALPLVEDPYDHEGWRQSIRGFEKEPERGRRCEKCFEFNLSRASSYAIANGFARFTTTLTISPHKDARQIFKIGNSIDANSSADAPNGGSRASVTEDAEARVPPASPSSAFLAIDLKKKDGFKKSLELSRKYGLYRQDYCGCEFSHRPKSTSGSEDHNKPPFYTHKQYMKDTYGYPLYRIPIDLALGCPHRRPDGTGGCSFCPEHGARAAQTMRSKTIEEQVSSGVEFARGRYNAEHLMAYVQAFTGTFATESEQRATYERILEMFKFDAISIGTRPDCLQEATLDFLCELKERLEVWIELGVQTVHDATLSRINRGHDWETSRKAILELSERGIKTTVHVILGLPGETAEDFNTTAETLAALPIDGIKIHNLHVMKGTALAEEFTRAPFPVYDEHEYAEILIDFLRRIPASVAVVRVNTDTPEDELIAPHWNISKPVFRDYVIAEMIRRGLRQGDLLSSGTPA